MNGFAKYGSIFNGFGEVGMCPNDRSVEAHRMTGRMLMTAIPNVISARYGHRSLLFLQRKHGQVGLEVATSCFVERVLTVTLRVPARVHSKMPSETNVDIRHLDDDTHRQGRNIAPKVKTF